MRRRHWHQHRDPLGCALTVGAALYALFLIGVMAVMAWYAAQDLAR